MPLLQIGEPLVTVCVHSELAQHCVEGMQAEPHGLYPAAQVGVPPQVPAVQVRDPFAMVQSAFVQHCEFAMQLLPHVLYPALHVQPHEPALHAPMAFAGTPDVQEVPSGALGYVAGQVPVEVLHETAR